MSSTSTRKNGRRTEPRRAIAVREKLLLLLAGFTALVAACAENPSAIRDSGAEQRALKCANHETLSCVEMMGKTVRCTCSSRDDLREILEPEKH